MTDTLEEIGLNAVDRFINTWNSRDAEAWAGSLNFPHVRPGPAGQILVAQDAAQYISGVDFDRVVKTGWDHSEWDYRQVLHTSADKIHVVGQWSRYTVDHQKMLTNPVVYIVTCVDGHWGIQSRFSADYAGDEDTSGVENRAFKLIELFCLHVANGNAEACASLLNYPHFSVHAGRLETTESAGAFTLPGGPIAIDAMQSLQTGRRSINVGMDVSMGGSHHYQAVVNITEREGHLGIHAWSLLDPASVTAAA
jgi:hypothetical protein